MEKNRERKEREWRKNTERKMGRELRQNRKRKMG